MNYGSSELPKKLNLNREYTADKQLSARPLAQGNIMVFLEPVSPEAMNGCRTQELDQNAKQGKLTRKRWRVRHRLFFLAADG